MVGDDCGRSSEDRSDPEAVKPGPFSMGLAVLIVQSLLMASIGVCNKGLPFHAPPRHGLIDLYFAALGFPVTLLAWFSPGVLRERPHAFVAMYVADFVVVSYCLGWLFGRILDW
ncbi:MAG: hypothetical protein ABFC96_01810, partial [Thermoguttaceae bacterium]